MLQSNKGPSYIDRDFSLKYKIKDITLAEEGHKDMQLSEKEMPGLMAIRKKYGSEKPFKGLKIMGSLHMTIQTAMLIDTLYELGADIRWASCNIFSTQDHAAAAIAEKGSAAVFAWYGTGTDLAGWFRPRSDCGRWRGCNPLCSSGRESGKRPFFAGE